eukprot:02696.XXX_29814_29999_1 [CDS] Oithona nana genome sequencing.
MCHIHQDNFGLPNCCFHPLTMSQRHFFHEPNHKSTPKQKLGKLGNSSFFLADLQLLLLQGY